MLACDYSVIVLLVIRVSYLAVDVFGSICESALFCNTIYVLCLVNDLSDN